MFKPHSLQLGPVFPESQFYSEHSSFFPTEMLERLEEEGGKLKN